MNCPSCGSELPADAQFCIECGVAIRQANTNPTVALPRTLDPALRCAACGSANPAHAIFCVRCGERIDATQSPILSRSPSEPLLAPAPPPYSPPVPQRRPSIAGGWPFGGAVFLIGMGLIFLLKLPFMPAILVLIGLTNFVSFALRGEILNGLSPLIWMFAIAMFFFNSRLAMPAIFVAIGLQVILSAARRQGF